MVIKPWMAMAGGLSSFIPMGAAYAISSSRPGNTDANATALAGVGLVAGMVVSAYAFKRPDVGAVLGTLGGGAIVGALAGYENANPKVIEVPEDKWRR